MQETPIGRNQAFVQNHLKTKAGQPPPTAPTLNIAPPVAPVQQSTTQAQKQIYPPGKNVLKCSDVVVESTQGEEAGATETVVQATPPERVSDERWFFEYALLRAKAGKWPNLPRSVKIDETDRFSPSNLNNFFIGVEQQLGSVKRFEEDPLRGPGKVMRTISSGRGQRMLFPTDVRESLMSDVAFVRNNWRELLVPLPPDPTIEAWKTEESDV
jgi:hypothetical protein